MSHKITVVWPDTSFPTSEEAMRVTRMSLVDAAKALGVNEPNVEQFQTRTNEPQRDEAVLAAMTDEFAETTDAMEWAKAFCARVRAGCDPTDEGWLVGWFANAIGAGERASVARHTEHARDAESGQYVTNQYAAEHPATTVVEGGQS